MRSGSLLIKNNDSTLRSKFNRCHFVIVGLDNISKYVIHWGYAFETKKAKRDLEILVLITERIRLEIYTLENLRELLTYRSYFEKYRIPHLYMLMMKYFFLLYQGKGLLWLCFNRSENKLLLNQNYLKLACVTDYY